MDWMELKKQKVQWSMKHLKKKHVFKEENASKKTFHVQKKKKI